MAEVGSGTVAIVPDFRGFRRGVTSEVDAATAEAGSQATKGFSDAGDKAGSGFARAFDPAFRYIGQGFSDLGTAVTQGLKNAGVAAAAVVGTALVTGFQRLTAIDDATHKLEGLGHSAEAVKGIMNDALISVQGTAFSLSDSATIAASAIAAGIQPGQQLQKYLRLTADAATIAGVSLTDMGGILNKVTSTGRAYTQDLNQLADKGIPIYQYLGKELGVTQDKLHQMVSAGEIDSATLQKALQDNIGGAALSAGDSVSGALDNMKTALARFGATIEQGGFSILPKLFDTISNGLDALGAKIGPIFDTLGAGLAAKLGPILDTVNKFFTGITSAGAGAGGINLSGFLGPLTALAPVIGTLVGSLGPLLTKIPLIGSAFSGITGPLGLIIGLFTSLLANSPQLRDAIGELVGTLGKTFGTLATALGPSLKLIGDVVNQVFGQLGDVVAKAIRQLLPLLPVILGLFTSLIPAIAPILQIIGTLAGILVGALGQALSIIIPPLVQVASVIAGVLQVAFSAIMPIIGVIAGLFQQLAPAIMPIVTIVAQLVAALLPLVAQLIGALAPVLQAIAPLFGLLLPPILQLLSPLLQLVGAILPPLVQLFMAVIGPVVDLATVIIGALVPVITGLVQILSGLINFVVAVFTGNWKAAWAAVQQIFNGFVNTINGAISGIATILMAIPNTIGRIFSGIGTWLVDAGKALINGFIKGIEGMIGQVGKSIGGIMDFAKSFFPHSPAERGPFSGSGWTDISEGGAAVIDEFTGGMATAIGNVTVPAVNLVGVATGAGSGTTSGTGAVASQPIEITQNIYPQQEDPRVSARAWSRELVNQMAGA